MRCLTIALAVFSVATWRRPLSEAAFSICEVTVL